ncbi:MAG: DUF2256 and DUF3253 domain-containing protein [Verrucomicrobiota bacterium]
MAVSKTKICPTCGLSFSWRKKWELCWDEVVYCSNRCRGNRERKRVEFAEGKILEILLKRDVEKTICPSEAARLCDPVDWRSWMTTVHNASRRLQRQGRVCLLQKGKPISPDDLKGPYRIGTKKAGAV